ncbi:MAG TPA: peptide-methionine (S)-S-oxide reductase [Pyrinomonadaceae bacterium]|nr:peptide-methionine (S)-S-oxide reductase [Pyrinomonadaceae bacterium]
MSLSSLYERSLRKLVFAITALLLCNGLISLVDASGKWKRPLTTTIEPTSTWYSAEDYHRDYFRKHPEGYNCHYMRD